MRSSVTSLVLSATSVIETGTGAKKVAVSRSNHSSPGIPSHAGTLPVKIDAQSAIVLEGSTLKASGAA